ncbi:hypothetical protein AsAng_0037260 [Aureispira anguillae]|uniref:Uncharacterized protein n=1 Tax=Aureispira anguillae TaxID=2864201 RepID=A0A915YH66_9BACT|nr:hypothetical protein AsAng_0037260 [Aureispira anguillae]
MRLSLILSKMSQNLASLSLRVQRTIISITSFFSLKKMAC